ncbi:MCE family protein [Nocardioides dongxiaopingii]|uniref:MCE family protein n=1 Tax=Nocardioides dongxiaopingii TaxID=2576036 RepID=UPI001BB09C6B|nr:MCE family protein [Nocardioides dongxiaopingii]
MNRLVRTLVALLLGSVVLSGCDFDVYDLPLPGGTDVGEDPLTVTVEFEDVLDLVPQSNVRVNDVAVGRVTAVELEGYHAEVTLLLRNDTELPADAVASIRQTSLLGEKFVSLAAPAGGGRGRLADGAVIPLERSGNNPEVEEVLGALSLVLNGGGLEKLRTISTEVNDALEGREGSFRSVLTQVADLMAQLDANKTDIVAAITSLNELSVEVRRQQPSIDNALDELPSALLSIDRQRGDLVRMLTALERLGDVGVRVINRSKDDTVTALRLLDPVLEQLANSGDDLVNSFNAILTYPFVDEVVGRDPQVARNLHMGDYVNLSVQLDLDLTDLPDLPGIPCDPLSSVPDDLPLVQIDLDGLCQDAQDAIAECLNAPSLRECRDLPAGVIQAVCANVTLPVLCGILGGVTGGGEGTPGLPGVPGLPPLPEVPDLGDILDGLLNPRPAPGGPDRTRRTTLGELSEYYDPALVTLLTPGMVTR